MLKAIYSLFYTCFFSPPEQLLVRTYVITPCCIENARWFGGAEMTLLFSLFALLLLSSAIWVGTADMTLLFSVFALLLLPGAIWVGTAEMTILFGWNCWNDPIVFFVCLIVTPWCNMGWNCWYDPIVFFVCFIVTPWCNMGWNCWNDHIVWLELLKWPYCFLCLPYCYSLVQYGLELLIWPYCIFLFALLLLSGAIWVGTAEMTPLFLLFPFDLLTTVSLSWKADGKFSFKMCQALMFTVILPSHRNGIYTTKAYVSKIKFLYCLMQITSMHILYRIWQHVRDCFRHAHMRLLLIAYNRLVLKSQPFMWLQTWTQ